MCRNALLIMRLYSCISKKQVRIFHFKSIYTVKKRKMKDNFSDIIVFTGIQRTKWMLDIPCWLLDIQIT